MPTKYFASTDTYVELKDTMKLQKASLDNFAANLYYFWDKGQGNYEKWNNYDVNFKRNRVSLGTMQKWHNGSYGEGAWHTEEDLDRMLAFMAEVNINKVDYAKSAKLVQTTHLQYSKKQRKLLCTNHQITFA